MQNIIMQPGGYQGSSEEQLLQLARQGSEEAFAELMHRHCAAARKAALGILRDEGDAEDELQNAWWKAWRHLGEFEGDSRFSTWVTRIVINQCLMRLRQDRRAAFLYLDAEIPGLDHVSLELRDESGTPEDRLCREEVRRLVTREIGRIPPLLRSALVLREVNQLPMPEVAERLGISLAAAKSRLLRARHELRDRLEKHCGGRLGLPEVC
jgi:RNA polymerase sigma-70 factor, ECF subfamily